MCPLNYSFNFFEMNEEKYHFNQQQADKKITDQCLHMCHL